MAKKNTPGTILGKRLYDLRIKKRLGLREVAELALVSVGQVHRIETGEYVAPTLPTIVKVAEALGTSIDYLSGRVDEEPTKSQRTLVDPTAREIFRIYEGLSEEKRKELLNFTKFLEKEDRKG